MFRFGCKHYAFNYGFSNLFYSHCSKYSSKGFEKSQDIPFSGAKHGSFIQNQPVLKDPYSGDIPLQRIMMSKIPKEALMLISPDLKRLEERILNEIDELGKDCELNPPKLIEYDAWGKRIDQLWTCDAWKRMKSISAEEGIVATGYERKINEFSRLHQFAKVYLFAPSSGLYSCPLAMTDGAAKTIETANVVNPLIENAYKRLISRDPNLFWTSGQWMTEKAGGSDVAAGTETLAFPNQDGSFRLYGYKWFSSAMDSDIALTLGRKHDLQGNPIQGTKGLSLFFLQTKNETGLKNNIQTIRLKNKLGTRQLPTAELLLDGVVSYQMSEDGKGVSDMSNMLTLTRIHNTISSSAAMRRILLYSRDYSLKRKVFGKKIGLFPLHLQTLARLEIEARGALHLSMEVVHWLGKVECNVATDIEKLLLRLMVPIAKLYTAKQSMNVASEGLESFGGQGYIEDTGLPRILRDCQVLPIWEGTTNILSLDVLRSIAKSNGEVLVAFNDDIISRLEPLKDHTVLSKPSLTLLSALSKTSNFIQYNHENLETAARDLSYTLARIYIGTLLTEFAARKDSTKNDIAVALRWVFGQELCLLTSGKALYAQNDLSIDRDLVMDGY